MTAAARVPLVAGIEPGVGTSTLAAALHAEDGGLLGQEADVVVCGSAPESLQAAAAVICPGRGPRPVLAVVTGPRVAPLPPSLGGRFGVILQVPRVPGWDGLDTAAVEAAEVLAGEPELLDPALRLYTRALRALVAALVDSGQLGSSAPPMVIRPRRSEPWRSLRPPVATAHPTPPADDEPGPATGRPAGGAVPGRHRLQGEIRIVDCRPTGSRAVPSHADQDDDAIEAATVAAHRRAGWPDRPAG